MENSMTISLKDSFAFDSIAEVKPVVDKQVIKEELVFGAKLGVAHGVPMLVSFVAAKLSLSLNLDASAAAIVATAIIQYAAPTLVLASTKSKLHKSTSMMLWTAIILGGINNGVLLSSLVR